MALTIINAELTRRLLPMRDCVEVMASAMAAVSGGAVLNPLRQVVPLSGSSDAMLLMPGVSRDIGQCGVKLISYKPGNPAAGLATIQGFVALFDEQTGAPLALVDGPVITELRTAAASGLATQELAREDAQSCGIFGTGVQAVSHMAAMCAVRPLREIVIWGRDPGKASRLAREQASVLGVDMRATTERAEAASCDVLCTVTGSATPVLKGEWVRPGTHVNLVGAHSLGSREADTALMQKADIYVDVLESVRNEGGNVMIPIVEGALSEADIRGEIGQLVNRDIVGRTGNSAVTLYNSLGVAAQDLYAAAHVYRRAEEHNLGVRVDF